MGLSGNRNPDSGCAYLYSDDTVDHTDFKSQQNILQLFEDNRFLKDMEEKDRKDINTIFKRMQTMYQKMGLVRYDAFNQMGGQLSYSLVMLDENDNGFIINSVHSTEGCYSYSKEIRNGDNSISLSKEEAEALAIAKGKKE